MSLIAVPERPAPFKSISCPDGADTKALQSALVCLQDYLGCIIDCGALGLKPEQVSSLFCNIEDIYEFNSDLLEDLERRPDAAAIAECFVERNESFDIYTLYCMNYPNSVAVLKECMKNETLVRFFQERQTTLNHSLPLETYLLKPVQRILKYHLLLQELSKHFDKNDPGYEVVEDAIVTMTAVAWYINDMKRKQEHAVRLQEIESLLVNWTGPNLSGFGELVLEGSFKVQRVKKERAFFLFDKMLLITKKRLEQFVYSTHIFCCHLMLVEALKDPLCFKVSDRTIPKQQHVVQAKNQEEKRLWVYYLKRLIVENHPASLPQKARQVLGDSFCQTPQFNQDNPKNSRTSPRPDDFHGYHRGRRQSEPQELLIYTPEKSRKSLPLLLEGNLPCRRTRRQSGDLTAFRQNSGPTEENEDEEDFSPLSPPPTLSITEEILEFINQSRAREGLAAIPCSSAVSSHLFTHLLLHLSRYELCRRNAISCFPQKPSEDEPQSDQTNFTCPLPPVAFCTEQGLDPSHQQEASETENRPMEDEKDTAEVQDNSGLSAQTETRRTEGEAPEGEEGGESHGDPPTTSNLPPYTGVDSKTQIVSSKEEESVEASTPQSLDLLHPPMQTCLPPKRGSNASKKDKRIIEKIRNYYETAAEADEEDALEEEEMTEGLSRRRNSFTQIPSGLVKQSVSRFSTGGQQGEPESRALYHFSPASLPPHTESHEEVEKPATSEDPPESEVFDGTQEEEIQTQTDQNQPSSPDREETEIQDQRTKAREPTDPSNSLEGRIKVGRWSRHSRIVTANRALFEGMASDVTGIGLFEVNPVADPVLIENSERILNKVQTLARMYSAKASTMKVPLHQKRGSSVQNQSWVSARLSGPPLQNQNPRQTEPIDMDRSDSTPGSPQTHAVVFLYFWWKPSLMFDGNLCFSCRRTPDRSSGSPFSPQTSNPLGRCSETAASPNPSAFKSNLPQHSSSSSSSVRAPPCSSPFRGLSASSPTPRPLVSTTSKALSCLSPPPSSSVRSPPPSYSSSARSPSSTSFPSPTPSSPISAFTRSLAASCISQSISQSMAKTGSSLQEAPPITQSPSSTLLLRRRSPSPRLPPSQPPLSSPVSLPMPALPLPIQQSGLPPASRLQSPPRPSFLHPRSDSSNHNNNNNMVGCYSPKASLSNGVFGAAALSPTHNPPPSPSFNRVARPFSASEPSSRVPSPSPSPCPVSFHRLCSPPPQHNYSSPLANKPPHPRSCRVGGPSPSGLTLELPGTFSASPALGHSCVSPRILSPPPIGVSVWTNNLAAPQPRNPRIASPSFSSDGSFFSTFSSSPSRSESCPPAAPVLRRSFSSTLADRPSSPVRSPSGGLRRSWADSGRRSYGLTGSSRAQFDQQDPTDGSSVSGLPSCLSPRAGLQSAPSPSRFTPQRGTLGGQHFPGVLWSDVQELSSKCSGTEQLERSSPTTTTAAPSASSPQTPASPAPSGGEWGDPELEEGSCRSQLICAYVARPPPEHSPIFSSSGMTSPRASYATTVNLQIAGSGRITSYSSAQVSLTQTLQGGAGSGGPAPGQSIRRVSINGLLPGPQS
uniref:Pleckstrin homology domain containing, family G (with RhoGef domain) member 2 n=1 Tax=Oryzias sinensis TaxID=183150 RepID=A0A8C8A026_9TELE